MFGKNVEYYLMQEMKMYRQNDVILQQVDNNTILINIATDQIAILNEAGSALWNKLPFDDNIDTIIFNLKNEQYKNKEFSDEEIKTAVLDWLNILVNNNFILKSWR